MKPVKFRLPNDNVIFTYPIRELAKRLNKSSESIRNMISKKAIPDTPFKIKDRRYFSDEQMNKIVDVARRCDIKNGVSFSKCGFTKIVYKELQTLFISYGIR